MTNPVTGLRPSKGQLLLMHMVHAGHVWRNEKGFWVATTPKFTRNVHLRIIKLVHLGLLETTYDRAFPRLTKRGEHELANHPLSQIIPGAQLRDLTRV